MGLATKMTVATLLAVPKQASLFSTNRLARPKFSGNFSVVRIEIPILVKIILKPFYTHLDSL
jgi:hypothetical protein